MKSSSCYFYRRCVLKWASKNRDPYGHIADDDMTEIEGSLDAVLRRAPSRSEVDFGYIKQVRAMDHDRQVYATNNNLSLSREVEQKDGGLVLSDVSYVKYTDQPTAS